jgi:hypothetical protein
MARSIANVDESSSPRKLLALVVIVAAVVLPIILSLGKQSAISDQPSAKLKAES